MKFTKYLPCEKLRSSIKYYAISENEVENEYKVFPSAGLVVGFQYRGKLSVIKNKVEARLASAGITGISDSYSIFRNSPGIGTVLVYFTETGFSHFAPHPANDLFNLSLSLDHVFERRRILETEEKLCDAETDLARIATVEHFLLQELKHPQKDRLVLEAIKLISESKGSIRIKELKDRLYISQSPLEKRFRQVVGSSPKKFASIIRFNNLLDQLSEDRPLTEICFDNNFFDQAHLIKDFRRFTGTTPEKFKKTL